MSSATTPHHVDELLGRGVAEVIDRDHLRQRLLRGDQLRVKLGIDPTGAKLHLGHAVPLRVLRRFQDAGHTVVLIIGDTTASIGDPSGKNETRPPLTAKDIARNLATYEQQALKILDRRRLEFHWQSEWFKKFGLAEVVREAAHLSAGWILSHETFRQRMKTGQPLAFHELLYPLLQAYDSVAVKADVEIGGLDQKFNLLTGRELMKAHGLEPQDIICVKYLIGTDGQKMGKSLGNFVALEEEPFEMFGKTMSMPDGALADYFELATSLAPQQWKRFPPRDAKHLLAETIVAAYHGRRAAEGAVRQWETFVSGEGREVFTTDVRGQMTLRDVLVASGLAKSKADAQRLIEQGGVAIDGAVEKDWGRDLVLLARGSHRVVVGKQKKTIRLRRL